MGAGQRYCEANFKAWAEGFTHDANPEREIRKWESYSAGMALVSHLPWPQRGAVFQWIHRQTSVGNLADE